MKVLNIEVLSKRSVLLQTTRNDDVEIVVADVKGSKVERTHDGKRTGDPGGVYDKVIATIPKHRRNLVADFLRTKE